MFDNEIKSGKNKPIGNFLNHTKLNDKKREILEGNYMVNLIDNLYLLTVPLVDGKFECDIEDLFEKNTLAKKIDGREFTKKDKYDQSRYYGKEIFSKHILENYTDINFQKFKPVLNNIENIIEPYNNEPMGSESYINKSSVPLEV